jgi:uncharacterized membrane protein
MSQTNPRNASAHRYHLAAASLILLSTAATLAAYSRLPNIVPAHWGAQADANPFGPKWSLFLYTPGLMIGILLMFITLPRISPRRFEMNSSRPSYRYIMLVIIALLSYSQLLVLLSGLGWNVDVAHATGGGVCLLLALLGNLIREMRPTKHM